MITIYEKPKTITKGKFSITFGVAVPHYNPDESLNAGFTGISYKYNIWLKFENTWYKIANSINYSSLDEVVKDFKKDVYSEEQFLEKILKVIE